MSLYQSITRVAWLAALALAVASCGGGSSAPSSPSAPTSPTAPTPPTPPTPPASSACSAAGALQVRGIVNGTECAVTSSPVVKLNLSDKARLVGYCSGTIIAPRAVLTAAHCLDGDVTSVKVFLGTGDQVTASSFSFHPSYRSTPTGGGSGLDVGVVLTSEDLARTPVPVLTSRDPVTGEQAVIAGWGQDVTGFFGNTLRAGTVTLSSVSSALLQSLNSPTASAVCLGDSGGPIFLSQGGAWVLGGVTSATSIGGSCASGTSFYTNVRHPDVISFILALVPGITPK